jgi:methyl-accepting chemotaxis protein
VCGAFLLALGVAAYSAAMVEHSLKTFIGQGIARHGGLSELYAQGLQSGQAVRNILLDPINPSAQNNLKAAREQFGKSLKELAALEVASGGKAAGEVQRLNEATDTARDAVLAAIKAGDSERAKTLLVEKETPAWRELRGLLLKELKVSDKAKIAFEQELAVSIGEAKNTVLAVSVMAVLLCIVLCWLLFRSVLRQLGGEPGYAAGVTTHIAGGDLTMEVAVRDGDSVSLLASMKSMQENLRSTVLQIKTSTDTITVASKEIAQGNADLSQRTEEQASSLEETASSMEELTSTVKQNAENAKQANQLAASASEVAVKGGKVVGEVVGTMSSINESSKKIVDIISVIDGIAFQTNILALNAAVEAARAGEQGRGFAVVASEVRNLAQRSAAAAKEIKALIGDSVDKVGAGTKLVDEAGKTMQEIVASVKRVTDIMSEIAAASQEQSSGIEQVNQAVTQMDEVTQQNAALVEEAAAAAEAMQEQAQNLAQVVSVFRLDVGGVEKTLPAAVTASVERCSASRPKNVAQLPAKRKSKAAPSLAVKRRTGTDGDWAQF